METRLPQQRAAGRQDLETFLVEWKHVFDRAPVLRLQALKPS